MKKLCALVLLLGTLAAAPGCLERCEGDERQFFEIRGLLISTIVRPNSSWSFERCYFEEVTNQNILQADRFGIRLSGEVFYYASNQVRINFPGLAYACSPIGPGRKGSAEIISDIQITSDAAFDSTHVPGSDLKEFFRISTAFCQESGPNSEFDYRAVPLVDFLSSQQNARQAFQLWLTRRPETALSHRFTVVYRQTNGEEYVVTTPTVTFQ